MAMGLDWIPGNKPKPGYEREFIKIVTSTAGDKLAAKDRPRLAGALRDRLAGLAGKTPSQEQMRARFAEISISAFETLQAPRVGFDSEADRWARDLHAKRSIAENIEDWLAKMRGYYVVALAAPCDGIPPYSNGALGYVEQFAFRAQFLTSCVPVIGALIDQAYYLKFCPDLMAYGDQLLASAQDFARSHGLLVPTAAPEDPDSREGQLHIVVAAARWCRYWADRGHYLEPYF
jgi:hypothetical protein